MINFLHTYTPEPLLLTIGPLKIYWYGFLMVVGGLLGLLVVLRLIKNNGIKKQQIFDLAFYWIIFAVIGARIYYVIYSWSYYQENLLEIFKIWQGGMAVHGVMIGGFLATYVFCRQHKINFWKLADIVVAGFVLAQVFGRWGNYFNQEIFGKPTDLSWGIPIEAAKRPIEYLQYKYFHPTFLYESFFNLTIFIDLMLLHWLKGKHPERIFHGLIFFYYLIAYSILRFCLEFLRIDDSPLVFGIRWAQIMSVLIIIAALVAMVILFKKSKRQENKRMRK